MGVLDRVVLLVAADDVLTRELLGRVAHSGNALQLPLAINMEQARVRLGRIVPTAILLDESALGGEGLEEAARELALFAPVVVSAEPAQQGELVELVASGNVDFVARGGAFLAMAMAFLERRLRCAERVEVGLDGTGPEQLYEFVESLRHEINNPLTGILGNAEMLLARRERLPAPAVQRLETIADLAVRLRETVRRASCAWESRSHARSA